MLRQYEVLEKRFGLSKRVTQSRWGKGIGERCSLHGDSRGYPLSLYDHFVKGEGGKQEWTSLVLEALFAGDIEFLMEFEGTQEGARFDRPQRFQVKGLYSGATVFSSDSLKDVFEDEAVVKRLEFLSKQSVCGSVRLNKGFLEYREVGVVVSEVQRLRFQEAILMLATLCDRLSLYASEKKSAQADA